MIHMVDSIIFGTNWGTEKMRALFDEPARLQGWLDVLAAFAESQAELGIISEPIAVEIKRVCHLDRLDWDSLQRGYQETGHSLLGLIRELAHQCSNEAGEWICLGATVQDITDTWLSIVLLSGYELIRHDVKYVQDILTAIAERHADTLMNGRTHGQVGLPITFGFKVAVWTTELNRHLQRLEEVRTRLGEGQLAGGVGTLSAFGERGFDLQERFFSKLGLRAPIITWCSSRDVLVEWMQLLALIANTFDKIGHEVYNLQRPEIGELTEFSRMDTVGSITMPHKRNPELAEHLGTLALIIRNHANALSECMVNEHERDGRSWKAEWALIPPAMVMMGALLQKGAQLFKNLEVNIERMSANVEATKGMVYSERIMLRLAHKVGKQTAHQHIHKLSMTCLSEGLDFKTAVFNDQFINSHLSQDELADCLQEQCLTRNCRKFVDRVLRKVRS